MKIYGILILKKKTKFDLIIVINASPYEIEKLNKRQKIAKKTSIFCQSPLIYANLVGSQDELIFDGSSFFMNKKGVIVKQADSFKESEFFIDINEISKSKKVLKTVNIYEDIYKALYMSLNNYIKKNNFSSILIGLSGGIDSALCYVIASDVVGKENLRLFFLPSIYTSDQSKVDAKGLSANLENKLNEISIDSLRENISFSLSPIFNNLPEDVTEENIQSRIRGLLLMAISNKFKSLLISTGNKSELLVGYSTLYGDMCGGFSLIKDLYKTQVIELSKWRNENILDFCKIKKYNIIPKNIIIKEPTAELKLNQKDTDSLPQYNMLDKILELLIDKNLDLKSIISKGYGEKLVKKIWKMVKQSEFKRYQSAIGPKITQMSLDSDRRFPITNDFKI